MKNEPVFIKWLIKSRNDLRSARKLSAEGDIVLDSAVYHCQQAGEKALKGYLNAKNIEFPKTHDLTLLNKKAVKVDADFVNIFDECELLTPYSVEFRYPDEIMEPTIDEYQDAFKAALNIYNFVSNKLTFFNPLP